MCPLDGIACSQPDSDTVGSSLRPVFYTVADAAGIALVTPQTVRRWLKTGKLTQHRAGRSFRVLADELHEFLRAGRVSVEPTVRRLEETAYTLNTDQRARLAAALDTSDSPLVAGGAQMTGTPAALDRQSVPTRQRLNELAEIHVREAIQQRARELADEAPSLTSEQIVLLRSIFVNQAGGGGG